MDQSYQSKRLCELVTLLTQPEGWYLDHLISSRGKRYKVISDNLKNTETKIDMNLINKMNEGVTVIKCKNCEKDLTSDIAFHDQYCSKSCLNTKMKNTKKK